MNLVVSRELVDELSLPTVGRGTCAKSAGVSGEGGGKDVSVVLQLTWVVGVAGNVVTERGSILG